MNIEHPTSNIEHRISMLDVRCSMFDVQSVGCLTLIFQTNLLPRDLHPYPITVAFDFTLTAKRRDRLA
jgi:hypothetical protein